MAHALEIIIALIDLLCQDKGELASKQAFVCFLNSATLISCICSAPMGLRSLENGIV